MMRQGENGGFTQQELKNQASRDANWFHNRTSTGTTGKRTEGKWNTLCFADSKDMTKQNDTIPGRTAVELAWKNEKIRLVFVKIDNVNSN